MDQLPQLLVTGGAAGALFYVLRLIVEGRLHSDSEINGLREDKKQLLAANARLATGVDHSNTLLQKVLERLGGTGPQQRGS